MWIDNALRPLGRDEAEVVARYTFDGYPLPLGIERIRTSVD
jgi:hypothetical protein